MNPAIKRWLTPAILMIAVLVVYRQVLEHEFTYFDDNAYVFRNPAVLDGLSWHTIAWAFSTTEVANYHPLTWLSHMLDVQIYGLWAGGHAFTNLLWHSINVLLVWRLARAITGQNAIGFFVAALFAIHPINVESVASISQRKTVLSACFGLLSLLAYLRYAERGGKWRYLWSLGAALLSLLAKPLFVTLPALLLLLDYWPLTRFPGGPAEKADLAQRGIAPIRGRPSSWLSLIIEKTPFAILAGASSIVTFYAQQAAGATSTAKVDALTSLAAAIASYFFYLQKLFWPAGLAMFYPLPASYSMPSLAGSALSLLTISAVCWWLRRSRPYLLFGWLWFVGTLVPMAGFVRVGGMAMADRYAYIPLLGIFIILILLANEWWHSPASQRNHVRKILLLGGLGALLGLTFVAHRQVGYWRTTARLFARDMTTQGAHPAMLNLMGLEAFDQGDFVRAIPCFQKALAVAPNNADATANLGIALFAVGRYEEAEPWLERASNLRHPVGVGVLNARGKIAEHQGRITDAYNYWRAAIAAKPAFQEARINLAKTLAKNANANEALEILDAGIRLSPFDERLHNARADILEAAKRIDEAREARMRATRQHEENTKVPAFRK